MEEDLLAFIGSAPGLVSLVDDRIQWAVREVPPSLALHLIDAPADRHLKGKTGLVQARVQMDAWATSFLGAKAIGDAAQAALPGIGQVHGSTKFLSCVGVDTERGRFGEAPNILHRTRIDVRVSYRPA